MVELETVKGLLARLRVLVIEDDVQGSKLIDMILGDLGISSIEHAGDGAEAWHRIEKAERPFDLIICDWNMPVMTGIQLLARVRDNRIHTPFIMITGRGFVESAVEAKQLGVSAYIHKPYSPRQLTEKIINVLGLRMKPDGEGHSE